jgi:hypothetical protein
VLLYVQTGGNKSIKTSTFDESSQDEISRKMKSFGYLHQFPQLLIIMIKNSKIKKNPSNYTLYELPQNYGNNVFAV